MRNVLCSATFLGPPDGHETVANHQCGATGSSRPAASAATQSTWRVAARRGGLIVSQIARAASTTPQRSDHSARNQTPGATIRSTNPSWLSPPSLAVGPPRARRRFCASLASIARRSSGASCSASTRPRTNCSAEPWKNRTRKSESRLPVASRRVIRGPVTDASRPPSRDRPARPSPSPGASPAPSYRAAVRPVADAPSAPAPSTVRAPRAPAGPQTAAP